MKKRKVGFVFALIMIMYAVVANHAAEAKVTYKSKCGSGDPKLGQQSFDLIPWFADLEKKLKDQPDYNQFTDDFLNNSKTLYFEVVFKVTDKGSIVDPAIRFSSDSSFFDDSFLDLLQRFLSLVKNSGPLSPPPNSLPVERGVEVSFLKVLIGEKKFCTLGRRLKSVN